MSRMTREEELKAVFEWLETNCNKRGYLYFEVTDENTITAYWKKELLKYPFARFYINQILEVIKRRDENEKDK